jgi:hypothetical protein
MLLSAGITYGTPVRPPSSCIRTMHILLHRLSGLIAQGNCKGAPQPVVPLEAALPLLELRTGQCVLFTSHAITMQAHDKAQQLWLDSLYFQQVRLVLCLIKGPALPVKSHFSCISGGSAAMHAATVLPYLKSLWRSESASKPPYFMIQRVTQVRQEQAYTLRWSKGYGALYVTHSTFQGLGWPLSPAMKRNTSGFGGTAVRIRNTDKLYAEGARQTI